jgi:hypothetical protein
VTVDRPRDEQRVVTFGRLYLNSLTPTRNLTPRVAPKASWRSRCVGALSSFRRQPKV